MTSGNSWLNVIFRRIDYWANQTGSGGLQRLVKVPGYPPAAILLAFPAFLFLIFGPTLGWRGWVMAALAPITWMGVLFGARQAAARRNVQWVVTTGVVVTAGLVWILAGPSGREADQGPYRHLLLPALVLLMIFAQVVPPLLARLLVATYRKRYFEKHTNLLSDSLRHAELFVRPSIPKLGAGRFLTSVLPTFFQHFLTLLFFPSLVAILVPHPWMLVSFLVTFITTWVIYSLGGVDTRLNAMLDLTKRAFFLGVQMLVSLLVIALAMGRLFEFSYISILLNSASVQVVIFYLAAAYTSLWLYEAWLHFALGERLLPLFLDQAKSATASRIRYEYEPGTDATNVAAENRFVQIHGSRFVVVGHFHSSHDPSHEVECFETYEKADLFEAVVRRSHPNTDADSLESKFGIADLRQRILTYFGVHNTLLLFGCWGAWALASASKQIAEYPQPIGAAESTFDLREKLFQATPTAKAENVPDQRPVIIVAASGGGTRAGLYTASVLQGLGELGALQDVALLSGVSGGSAAIAYLTVHRGDLVDKKAPLAWKRYADVLAEPFIEDVLSGAAELRTAYGYRLGNLLDESFQRRMDASPTVGASARLGQSDVGLIFNSTLAGSSEVATTGGWGPRSPKAAGGRAVFTNVRSETAFPLEGYDAFAKDEYLNYKVIRDKEMLLSTAAALSANFPPVFSNALVETPRDRYWVTDGGASENRGGVSALYVLRDALRRESAARAAKSVTSLRSPPEIHVIIAEASAYSMDYSEDRGVGSTLGASEKYASQLMVELMRNIKQEYISLGGNEKNLYLHYLPMPLVFRARGGVGTHWMLGSYVTLTESVPDPRTAASVTLSGQVVKDLIMDLHRSTSPRAAKGTSDREKENIAKVWEWIGKDSHKEAWSRLVKSLDKR